MRRRMDSIRSSPDHGAVRAAADVSANDLTMPGAATRLEARCDTLERLDPGLLAGVNRALRMGAHPAPCCCLRVYLRVSETAASLAKIRSMATAPLSSTGRTWWR